MNKCFTRKIRLPASLINTKSQLGFVDAVTCLQDNMCEYFKVLGCDGITMLPICNAFFVITKTLIKFVGSAKWLDDIELRTMVAKKSNIRVNLSNNIYCNEKPVVLGIQEMCAVDGVERKIRTVDSTLFPKDIECIDENDLIFSKFMVEFDECDLVKEIIIDSSHLDFYKHTNNVEYVRFILSTMTIEEIENNQIDTFEMHYINQTVWGDKLKIYKKSMGKNVYFQMITDNGVVVNKSQLTYM